MQTVGKTTERKIGAPAEGTTSSSPLPDEELLALRRFLQRAQGFALAFVRSNIPAESRRIVGDLQTSFGGTEMEVRELHLSRAVGDLYDEIDGLRPEPRGGQALTVTGFERSIPSEIEFPPALERLNLQREHFRSLPCPLILILPDYALDLFARKAPDFWSWRSGVFESRPISERLNELVINARLPTNIGLGDLSHERKQDHLKVLMSTLADLKGEGAGTESDRSELSLNIAQLLTSLGKLGDSEEYARKALELAGNDRRARGAAWRQIADIYHFRGDLDEALRIRQEEELPAYEKLGDVRERAVTMGRIADIYQSRGDLNEALRIRQEEELPVYEKLGDVRERAVTVSKVAAILQAKGDLDEAMRIYKEEVIPVTDRLGEGHGRAIAMGKIADIYQSRGDLDEALRIRQEEELPVYEKLGDVRSRAITMGQIADMYESRGDFDEAMRIHQEEEIPVYDKIGDVRSRAVTMGKIADILYARGDFDEAMRIRQEEEIPVYDKIGDVRSRAITMRQIADMYESRGDFDEAMRIRQEEEIPVYDKVGDVRSRAVTMGKIADVLYARGDLDEAMRIYREEELPVYEKLGDVRSRIVTDQQIALIQLHRDREGDREKATQFLARALRDAESLEIPEAERIRKIMQDHKLPIANQD